MPRFTEIVRRILEGKSPDYTIPGIALKENDKVIITDIYAARSREKPVISSRDLAEAVKHRDVRYLGSQDEVVSCLLNELSGGDLLLTLGAGDGYRIGERVLAELKERGKR